MQRIKAYRTYPTMHLHDFFDISLDAARRASEAALAGGYAHDRWKGLFFSSARRAAVCEVKRRRLRYEKVLVERKGPGNPAFWGKNTYYVPEIEDIAEPDNREENEAREAHLLAVSDKVRELRLALGPDLAYFSRWVNGTDTLGTLAEDLGCTQQAVSQRFRRMRERVAELGITDALSTEYIKAYH